MTYAMNGIRMVQEMNARDETKRDKTADEMFLLLN